MAGPLKAAGFEMREAAGSHLPTNRSWEVNARIDGADDGSVERVFMMKGSGDAATDADVLREIHRGKAPSGRGPFSGNITVGWCVH